jgi:hypothetical protein
MVLAFSLPLLSGSLAAHSGDGTSRSQVLRALPQALCPAGLAPSSMGYIAPNWHCHSLPYGMRLACCWSPAWALLLGELFFDGDMHMVGCGFIRLMCPPEPAP